jgi:hypothetical protein
MTRPLTSKLPLYPNATETLAERAWRYGETGLPHHSVGGYWLFADGSSLWRRWCVHTARSHRRVVEVTHGHAGRAG